MNRVSWPIPTEVGIQNKVNNILSLPAVLNLPPLNRMVFRIKQTGVPVLPVARRIRRCSIYIAVLMYFLLSSASVEYNSSLH
jgi:hypothetical protein